jgi:hypothetical protein
VATQPTVKFGSKGAAVRLCQERLAAKGFDPGAPDGDFRERTRRAVEQFQASCGLTADGVVGPLTWNLLMAEGRVKTPDDVLAEQRDALSAKVPAAASPEVRAVLLAAIGRLGDAEEPDGSNGGPRIADIVEWSGDGKPPSAYYQHWRVTDPAVLGSMPPWCCLFVSWAIRKGLGCASWRDTPFGAWFGGCAQVEEWAKGRGRWVSAVAGIVPPGSLFTISRGDSGSDPSASASAGHIGFVVCDNGDGTVTTIEGNVSNRVGSHVRSKTSLRGIASWW